MAKKLKCAILGFGGMGHHHSAQYANQKDVELVAICDIDPKKLETTEATINLGNSGKSDLSKLRKYTCYEDMVKAEGETLDIIDICLPAYLHAEYSIRAMKDGYNVLCEKPMALNSRDCDKMIAVQKATGKKLMIAQCIRFSDDYAVLEKLIASKKYGKLLKLDMIRFGNYPLGASGWYMDSKRSGGAIIDLHLHDLDWILAKLGTPKTVSTRGMIGKSGGWDEAETNFTFPKSDLIVVALGSWMRAQAFQAGFTANFEKAVLHCGGGKLTLTDIDGKEIRLAKPKKPTSMYFNEIAYFAKCVKTNKTPEFCMPESTRQTVRVIELERLSAKAKGKPVAVKQL